MKFVNLNLNLDPDFFDFLTNFMSADRFSQVMTVIVFIIIAFVFCVFVAFLRDLFGR